MEPDIRAGFAAYLDPTKLAECGATYNCDAAHRVQGPHWFLCFYDDGATGRWAPLFSRWTPTREVLPMVGRSGDTAWREGTFHYTLRQIWTATRQQVAAARPDRFRPWARNYLGTKYLPSLPTAAAA